METLTIGCSLQAEGSALSFFPFIMRRKLPVWQTVGLSFLYCRITRAGILSLIRRKRSGASPEDKVRRQSV